MALLAVGILLVSLGTCKKDNASAGGTAAAVSGGKTVEIPNGKYKLAVYLPMTGNFMQYGQMLYNGMKLAVKHWNEEYGGINGHQIEIDLYDDKNDQTECVNIAELITSKKDQYIASLGTFASGTAMAATPIYEREQLLMFNPCGSHPDFYKQGEYIFAIAMTTKYESLLYAKAFYEQFGIKNLGMIAPQNDSFFITKKVWDTYAERNNANFYYELFVQGNTQDYTPVISRLFNNHNLDAVYLAADYITNASILLQMETLGLIKPGLMIASGGQSAVQEFLPVIGDIGNGTYVITSAPVFYPSVMASFNPTPTLDRFVREFTADYNLMADSFGGQGYDTVMAVLNCVEKYKTTDSTILKDHVGELVGLEEPVSGDFLIYNEKKQMRKPLYIYRIEDNEFKANDPLFIILNDEEERLAGELAGF
jgi:branched-chain amino acid transport system substrate-binding protein